MQLRERQHEAIYGGEFGPGILNCWNPEWKGVDASGTEVSGGQSTLVVAATGFGKCLAPGTPVLMYSGEVKKVEDIRIGDVLMGPDSSGRRVLSLAHGWDEMFRVTPTKGDSYTVNRAHILSLRVTGGAHVRYGKNEIVNVPIEEYLKLNKTYKHCLKGWRTGIEFQEKKLLVEPYYLGLWLGDGESKSCSITTGDLEIVNYLDVLAWQWGLRCMREPNSPLSEIIHLRSKKGEPNELKRALRDLRVLHNKHIPLRYRTASRWQRLELLAGLIDSDGFLVPGGTYEISQKSDRLADDILFLARSLGFAAYNHRAQKECVNNGAWGTYNRITISGNIEEIPCIVPRKKASPRKQKKNVLNVGIEVDPVGRGEYFGFQIDGDGLFLLGDFTVTHNTVLFAGLADLHLQERSGRVMLLTHRDKLLWQAKETFQKFGYEADVEMGEFRADESVMFSRDIVCMTVQTGRSGKKQKRFEKFDPDYFGLVIVDEAHHAPSNEFLTVINHFKKNPECKILGVTATPDRHDMKALRAAFDTVAYSYGLQRAINDGWLCPIEVQFHELLDYDLSNVRARGDDFVQSELENELLKHVVPCAQKLYEVTREELTLHFCAGINQAKAMADALNAIRPGIATYILGTTPDERRTEIYQSFVPDGPIRYLINVGVATEGYDNPYVQHISLDRPTKSRSLLEQMIGRGSRTWPGIDLSGDAIDRRERIALSPKPVNKIHDFVGIMGKHKLVTVADILGGNDVLNAEVTKRIRKSGKPADVAELMLQVSKEFEEQERVRRAKEFHRSKATYRTQFIDPFNLFQISDTRKSSVDGCRRLSENQLHVLVRAGYDPSQLSSTQGKQLVGKLMERRSSGLATPKQVKLLRDKGVPEPENIPFQKASAIIDQIARNHWQFHPSMMQ